MRILIAAVLISVLHVCGWAQDAPPRPDAPGVTVRSFRWYKFRPGWDKAPVGRVEREPTRDQFGQLRSPGAVLDASPKSQEGYKYRARVTNVGSKNIRAIVWEYRFTEAGSGEAHSHRFRTVTRIGPGRSKELVAFSYAPPSRTINVASLGLKGSKPFEEQVLINRVEYSDGSTWQRP